MFGMLVFLAVLLIGLSWVGHACIFTAVLNYVYGCRLPKVILKPWRYITGVLILAFPWVVWNIPNPESYGSPGTAILDQFNGTLGRVFLVYCIACVYFGTVFPMITIERYLQKPPACLVSETTRTLDLWSELGHKLIGDGKNRLLTHVPGNGAFKFDITDLTLALPNLPPEWDGLTLLHLSDLHFHGTPSRAYFDRVVDELAAGPVPDLVCLTGDYVDSDAHRDWIVPLLGRLKATEAKLAVLGNHDDHYEPDRVRAELTAAGYTVLGNRWCEITVQGTPCVAIGNEGPWFVPPPDLTGAPRGSVPPLPEPHAGQLLLGQGERHRADPVRARSRRRRSRAAHRFDLRSEHLRAPVRSGRVCGERHRDGGEPRRERQGAAPNPVQPASDSRYTQICQDGPRCQLKGNSAMRTTIAFLLLSLAVEVPTPAAAKGEPPDSEIVALIVMARDPVTAPEAVKQLVELGPDAVPVLTQGLWADSAATRRGCAVVLAEIGADARAAVPSLVRALRDDSKDVRLAAARALGAIQAHAALPALTKALKDEAPAVRLAAAGSLIALGADAGAVLPVLTRAVESDQPEERYYAIELLGELGPEAAPAVLALQGALVEADPALTARIAETLGRIGPEARTAAPVLKKKVQDDKNADPFRVPAAIALWRIARDGAAVDLLRDLLATKKALWPLPHNALWRIDPSKETVDALVKLLKSEDDRDVLRAAEVLGRDSKEALPALLRVFKKDDGADIVTTLSILARIGPDAKQAARAAPHNREEQGRLPGSGRRLPTRSPTR